MLTTGSTTVPGEAALPIDARPLRVMRPQTAWDRARLLRDELANAIQSALDEAGTTALLLKSQDGNFPSWVRLEAWLPPNPADAGGERVRSELEIVIDVRSFRRKPLVFAARAACGKQVIRLEHATAFSARDAAQWAGFALGRRRWPDNYRPRTDQLLAVAGLLAPHLRPGYNPQAAGTVEPLLGWPALFAAAMIALYAAALALPAVSTAIAIGIGIAGFASICGLLWLARRGRALVAIPAQPFDAPRKLIHVDSWHAVLGGLGGDVDAFERRVRSRLSDVGTYDIWCRDETYGFRKPNGYEERRRLVLSRGQGFVHVHFSRFGDDLFVGWHAQLNLAYWAETMAISRTVDSAGETEYRNLVPGWYLPDAIDLFDLDSLTALVHRRIEREARELLAERRSRQEVDFEILRGDRDAVLQQGRLLSQQRPENAKHGAKPVLGRAGVQQVSLGEMTLSPPGEPPRSDDSLLAGWNPALLMPVLTAVLWFALDWQFSPLARAVGMPPPPDLYAGWLQTPDFSLALALVLALAVWTWGNVRPAHAILSVPLAMALTFGVGAIAERLAPSPDPGGTLAGSLIFAASWMIAGLLAVAVFSPQLRRSAAWWLALMLVLGIVAASHVALAAGLQPRGSELAVIASMEWVARSLFAGTVGYWLWREAGGRLVKPRRSRLTSPNPAAAVPWVSATHGASALALLVLPLVTALLYAGLYQSPGLFSVMRVQTVLAPGYTFAFSPVFVMPSALALALGLVLWGRANPMLALAWVPALAFATLASSFAAQLLLSTFTRPRDWTSPGIVAAVNFYLSFVSVLVTLVLLPLISPVLRQVSGRTWLAVAVLVAAWAAGVNFVIRGGQVSQALIPYLSSSTRVLLVAIVGVLLLRPTRGQIVAPHTESVKSASVSAVTTPTVVAPAGWLVARTGGLVVALIAIAAIATLGRLPMGTPSGMGAGVMPLTFALLLAAGGTLLLLFGDRRPWPVGGARLRHAIAAVAALMIFAGLIKSAGLLAASLSATLASGILTSSAPREILVQLVAVGIVAFAIAIGFGLDVPLLPTGLGMRP